MIYINIGYLIYTSLPTPKLLESLNEQSCHCVWLFSWKNYITLDLVILELMTEDRAEIIVYENPAGKITAGMNCDHLKTILKFNLYEFNFLTFTPISCNFCTPLAINSVPSPGILFSA